MRWSHLTVTAAVSIATLSACAGEPEQPRSVDYDCTVYSVPESEYEATNSIRLTWFDEVERRYYASDDTSTFAYPVGSVSCEFVADEVLLEPGAEEPDPVWPELRLTSSDGMVLSMKGDGSEPVFVVTSPSGRELGTFTTTPPGCIDFAALRERMDDGGEFCVDWGDRPLDDERAVGAERQMVLSFHNAGGQGYGPDRVRFRGELHDSSGNVEFGLRMRWWVDTRG